MGLTTSNRKKTDLMGIQTLSCHLNALEVKTVL